MKIAKSFEYCYTLHTAFGKEVGRIDTICSGDDLEIVRFCVAITYRGRKNRYGKQLIDKVVEEARNTGIHHIYVTPKAEEIYDDIVQMELSELYRKYLNLGFNFIDNGVLKPYGNAMKMRV